MQINNEYLKDFTCALSFKYEHFIEFPVLLSCEHAACKQCVDNLKSNTGLKQIKCLKCNKENSLEVDYVESDLLKNYMSLCAEKITQSLEKEFDETVQKSKSIKKYKIKLNIAF